MPFPGMTFGPFPVKVTKKKTKKHKEFWRDTPWFVSHLSRGHVPSVPSSVPQAFCPDLREFPHKSAQTSRVSLGRPEFILGTLPGHSDHQIPLCDISLLVFCSLGGRFGYFFFFSSRGGGRGARGVLGGGGIGFLLKIPGGGFSKKEGPRGREGICGGPGNLLGGGPI